MCKLALTFVEDDWTNVQYRLASTSLRKIGEQEGGSRMAAQSAPALDLSTKLAFERTWVAYERTILDWVRTASSLISFWLQRLQILSDPESWGRATQLSRRCTPIGLLLVSIGLISLTGHLAVSAQNIRMLGAEYQGRPRSQGGHRGTLISILGILHPGIDYDDFSTMTSLART